MQPIIQPQQLPEGERIVGILEDCKHGFPANKFTLFLTDRRIIVAKTGGFGALFAENAGMATGGGLIRGIIGLGLGARSSRGTSKTTVEYFMRLDQILGRDKKT